MITNESAMDRLSLVSRMLAYQQAQGDSLASAITKTRLNLPRQYADSIDAIENIVSGDKKVVFTGYGTGPFEIYTALAKTIREERGDVSQLFIGAKDCIREAVVQAREYWSGFSALIVYLIVVLVLAMMVVGIFTIKVLPGFAEVFSGFGAELPALTKFVLQNDSIFTLITVVLMLGVFLCVACSYHVRKQVAQLRPLTYSFRWFPGGRSLDHIYSYFLFIHFVNVLTIAGVKQTASFQHAKDLARLTDKNTATLPLWWEAIQAAKEMGVLDQEIQYQIAQINVLFSRQMILLREAITLLAQISLGLLIGLLVIAMYLPIFMLGSVV